MKGESSDWVSSTNVACTLIMLLFTFCIPYPLAILISWGINFQSHGLFWKQFERINIKVQKKIQLWKHDHWINIPKSHHQRKFLQKCLEDPEIPSQKAIRLGIVCKRSDVGKMSCHKFKSGISNLKVQNQNLIRLFQITFKRRWIFRFNIGKPINRKIMIFANTFWVWSLILILCTIACWL